MSIASKRRFVTKQVKSELVLPTEGDIIAQILGTRGNNLHEIEDANGEKYLASMPTKFRKSVWVKRGQFVLVRPIEEGDKVKAEITNVLDDENVLYIREQKLWPERFEHDAERLTRESKRDIGGGDKKHEVIDADMLPPSESDDDEEEEEEVDEMAEHNSKRESAGKGNERDDTDSEVEESDEEESDGERPIIDVYNPNRGTAPRHR